MCEKLFPAVVTPRSMKSSRFVVGGKEFSCIHSTCVMFPCRRKLKIVLDSREAPGWGGVRGDFFYGIFVFPPR